MQCILAKMRSALIIVFYLGCFLNLLSQNVWLQQFQNQYSKEFSKKYYVDSLFLTLNEDEILGQLFMIAAYSNKDSNHVKQIDSLIQKHHIGGLIFFQGGPLRQAHLTNHYQSISKIPLFIAIDGEWGLNMRLDSTIRFPHQLTLGAIQNDSLIYEFGKIVANECKRLGVHINFAPVVDVNNNANNPVINDRSFGEDKINVALKGLMYAKGMQDNGVMACAKHFPGHGDTDSDSHYSLPVINKSLTQLDSLELYPFKVMFNEGVQSVMAAHLFIPAIDNTENIATSLSYNSTTKLLKKQMGFNGLVFSDALNMKGVSKFYKPAEVAFMAFKAGNDVLLFAEDVPKAIEIFKKAIVKKEINQQEINEAVKKILSAKYDYQLFQKKQQIDVANLFEDINKLEAKLLNKKLFENAFTLVNNTNQEIPFKEIQHKQFASLMIGEENDSVFQNTLSLYAPFQHFSINKSMIETDNMPPLQQRIQAYNTIVIGLCDMSRHASKNYGLEDAAIQFINNIAKEKNVVLVVFGNPYSLKYFENIQVVLNAYEDNINTRMLAPQIIFGAISAKGKLPITASESYKVNTGIITQDGLRLRYIIPEEIGIDARHLGSIDSLAIKAISEKMTPGCQILFAKNGKVFYKKSFGFHTYDSTQKVLPNDLYDVASITKIAATTISLMKLYDEKKFLLESTVSNYLKLPKKSSIADLKMKDILIHQAGFTGWIPFYLNYTSLAQQRKWFRMFPLKGFDVKVADSMYTKHLMIDSLYNTIYKTKIEKKPEYKYSDLGFYLFAKIIKEITKTSIDSFVDNTFYKPLGLQAITYNPLLKFSKEKIIPTEKDTLFRKQLIHGYVHDPGAALIGGVSGHSGLFSNTTDIAILMQMLLNKGSYGGKQYLDSITVDLFTKTQVANNRRGLGFDKPDPLNMQTGPTAEDASSFTFGHNGFTGTCTWADPANGLVYVFLSNRVYPNATNNKLASNNIRTEIMQVVYDALKKSKQP